MTSAREQTARLADLLRREHSAMADFLVALAAFDRKRLWEELGHTSLFYFLHRELGLPKGPAFYRKTAAELIQRYPEIVEPLRNGRLCLTSVVELSKVITPENRTAVVPGFFHLSKREAKAVSAALLPDAAPPRREVVTAVRAPAAAAGAPFVLSVSRGEPEPLAAAAEASRAQAPVTLAPGPSRVAAPLVLPEEPTRAKAGVPGVSLAQAAKPRPAPVEVEPLTADLRRLHVTVSRRLLDKLEAVRAALSHSHPGASADAILEAGLDLLLERAAKRRGLVAKPRPPREQDSSAALPGAPGEPDGGTDRSRDARRERSTNPVPAHVKRAVWRRDGGKCQWKLDSGGICGSTHRLQIDHVVPRAQGGPSTVENCRILCALHNDLAARKIFGAEWMDRFTRRRAPASGMPPPSVTSP